MSRLGAVGTRLYRGETSYDFIGKRNRFYGVSGLLVLVSIVTLAIFHFNLSIEFKGGAAFQLPVNGHVNAVADATSVITDEGIANPIVQKVGGDVRVETKPLTRAKVDQTQVALAKKFGFADVNKVSPSEVGASWGRQITQKAVEGLIAFLIAVSIYISIRFEPRMAASAMVALLHDLLITAGVYAVTRFEVSPATVIAILTILGYSLYDTVVVFDKVQENTRGITARADATYTQAANLAVNQTLARSINTSLIALLPVGGLLFVGAGLLGAGTLKDLSLALFVGILVGTYSSIFIATPILAELKEREPQYKALAARIAARGASAARTQGKPAPTPAGKAAMSTAPGRAVTAVLEHDESLKEPPESPSARETLNSANRPPARSRKAGQAASHRRGGGGKKRRR